MTETEANTLALSTNTEWIIISIIVAVVLFIGGFILNKYRSKNIIKKSKNKRGRMTQVGGENLIDNVDNEEGNITQK